jgi:hypothetical protein
MNPLYYQYGTGPASMQTPDYQSFLRLLEEMRKQQGGDSTGKQQGPDMVDSTTHPFPCRTWEAWAAVSLD